MKGIIFDSESVKAILAGNKTQSRRIIKGARLDDNELLSDHHPRYYVGETVYVKESYADLYPATIGDNRRIAYKATDTTIVTKWQTPLFMPESLSRIKLQIVRVGCERVHDISAIDVINEGVWSKYFTCVDNNWFRKWQARWIHVNGQASWNSNPWVWVYEFVRVS